MKAKMMIELYTASNVFVTNEGPFRKKKFQMSKRAKQKKAIAISFQGRSRKQNKNNDDEKKKCSDKNEEDEFFFSLVVTSAKDLMMSLSWYK